LHIATRLIDVDGVGRAHGVLELDHLVIEVAVDLGRLRGHGHVLGAHVGDFLGEPVDAIDTHKRHDDHGHQRNEDGRAQFAAKGEG
jgi:hypothetical protein